MLTRALWCGCQSGVREVRSLVTPTVLWKPSAFLLDGRKHELDDRSSPALARPDQDAEPSTASTSTTPPGSSPLINRGSFTSPLQQRRHYSAAPPPPPPPHNETPRPPQTPPQGPDPWAQLEGQAGQSRLAPSSSAAGGSPRQGSHHGSPQRQLPGGQGGSRPLGRPLGRSQGGPQQQGPPPGERDAWAELETQASRAPSRGPPPGQYQGGFSGGFQGRSRELVNLKQRQAGIVSIMSSNNNTIITLSDTNGRVQSCISAGCLGFSNSRKSTTQAAEAVGEAMAEKARSLGFTTCEVNMKGMGFGKQRAVRALHGAGLMITAIHEKTPVAHNGCRRPRKRRG